MSVQGARVLKPRTVFWEWLVLSPDSPLRRCLDDAAEQEGIGRDAFGFLPSLDFQLAPDGRSGSVERLELAPLRSRGRAMQRSLAVITGRSLALWSWLGVSDLHWENLVLGVGKDGQIVFGPLDVEIILDDLELPTHTKLLPDADPEYSWLYRHAAGVRRVLPYLGKPLQVEHLLEMVVAYRQTLDLLDRHGAGIAAVLEELPQLREQPIRVCLRSTEEYLRIEEAVLWPPLLDAEIDQLARADVPYFFRLYGRPGIHYYVDEKLERTSRLPLHGDVPRLPPLLELSRGLRSKSRESLRNEGLFALVGAFDDASYAGRYEIEGAAIHFRRQRIELELARGEELHSRRNLATYVGSVYLPCRCGEVRTAFVPAVTKCSAAPEP